jgi:hypothetical protein
MGKRCDVMQQMLELRGNEVITSKQAALFV